MTFIRLLEQEFYGNPLGSYLISLGILIFGLVFSNLIARLSGRLSFRLFKKFSHGRFSQEFTDLLKAPFKLVFVLVFIHIASSYLEYPAILDFKIFRAYTLHFYLNKVLDIIIIAAIVWILMRFIDFSTLVFKARAQETESRADVHLVSFMRELVKFSLALIGFFIILGLVFKVNVGGLITGLGLGGLAIALAAQETISNLLGSFIIFLDKPFKAGDVVSVDNIIGTIENVGFRSTRIRTLDKSLLTVPNKKLVDNPLNNITLSSFRRVRFTVGLVYGTKAAAMKKICADIEVFLKGHKLIDEDITVVFLQYGASSLDILVEFFVPTNNWDVMVRVKEEVNYRIMEIVETNGSSFAFPTQTVFVEKKNEGT